jgi:hypothetical protein
MSLSPIGAIASSQATAEIARAIAPSAPAAVASATLQPDTVSISSAGKAAAASGGHDGDSDAQ